MSPMSPWMGSPKNEGEWIVLRGGFHSPAHFLGGKKNHENQKCLESRLWSGFRGIFMLVITGGQSVLDF